MDLCTVLVPHWGGLTVVITRQKYHLQARSTGTSRADLSKAVGYQQHHECSFLGLGPRISEVSVQSKAFKQEITTLSESISKRIVSMTSVNGISMGFELDMAPVNVAMVVGGTSSISKNVNVTEGLTEWE
jgi:hypothetical protein